MATAVASPTLQLSYIIATTFNVDGRRTKTVSIQGSCNSRKEAPYTNLSSSFIGTVPYCSQSSMICCPKQRRVSGRNTSYFRLSANDSSSMDSPQTSDGTNELPSDSADSDADVGTIEALESNETEGKGSEDKDDTIIKALEGKGIEKGEKLDKAGDDENGAASGEVYPSGDLVFKKKGGLASVLVQCRLLFAWPWQRVKKGSVLNLKLSGQITEQYQGRFMQGLSLPQICENLIKAANDPRIAGVLVSLEPLDCGWGKLDEIRRHMEYFKQSAHSRGAYSLLAAGVRVSMILATGYGKFLVAYMEVGGEKEYYLACACQKIYAPQGAYISLLGLKVQAQFLGGVLEKAGVQAQVQRIGKYKSAGDQLSRKDMSEANREMLTALLDDIYANFLEQISISTGKTKEDIEALLDAGIFEIEKLKEGGWITDIKYFDEVEEMLKEKIAAKKDKPLRTVEYRKYNRVSLWTLGLSGGGDCIAVLRASGNISRKQGGGLGVGGEGIASETFVEKIRYVREAKQFKAVILRIDSPGGDALASDLMWREIKLLAKMKPVVASMADVAASGGYYMAMAAGVILAEKLTITGSIGVVTAKFNLGELYNRVGFAKEIISKGRFAELDADQRPFRPEEEDWFKQSAMNAYTSFRDKAAKSRSMAIERMEEVAQGRVWTGTSAESRGLVDTLGGFSKAVAIAKQKAGIAEDKQVILVELSRRQASPLSLIRGGVSALSLLSQLIGSETTAQIPQTLVEGILSSNEVPKGVQARMDSISINGVGTELVERVGKTEFIIESVEASSLFRSLLTLLNDILL